jgi:hypothetical protein
MKLESKLSHTCQDHLLGLYKVDKLQVEDLIDLRLLQELIKLGIINTYMREVLMLILLKVYT